MGLAAYSKFMRTQFAWYRLLEGPSSRQLGNSDWRYCFNPHEQACKIVFKEVFEKDPARLIHEAELAVGKSFYSRPKRILLISTPRFIGDLMLGKMLPPGAGVQFYRGCADVMTSYMLLPLYALSSKILIGRLVPYAAQVLPVGVVRVCGIAAHHLCPIFAVIHTVHWVVWMIALPIYAVNFVLPIALIRWPSLVRRQHFMQFIQIVQFIQKIGPYIPKPWDLFMFLVFRRGDLCYGLFNGLKSAGQFFSELADQNEAARVVHSKKMAYDLWVQAIRSAQLNPSNC